MIHIQQLNSCLLCLLCTCVEKEGNAFSCRILLDIIYRVLWIQIILQLRLSGIKKKNVTLIFQKSRQKRQLKTKYRFRLNRGGYACLFNKQFLEFQKVYIGIVSGPLEILPCNFIWTCFMIYISTQIMITRKYHRIDSVGLFYGISTSH